MQGTSKICKSVIYIALFVFFLSCFPMDTVYAGNLQFYNYNSGSYESYSGKQIVYTFNSRELSLEHPGILVNGTALADCTDLFGLELGLQVEISDDCIRISDGNTELILTAGSTSVFVNGKAESVSVAPRKLLFGDEVKYYVPTRYVAETLGYDYVWVSDISTVRITKTFPLICDDKTVAYNGTLFSVTYQNNRVYTELPILNYNGCVMVPAKQVFEAADCVYSEKDKTISVSKGELTFQTELGSKIAYINQNKIIGYSAPIQITESSSGKTATYISLEFVADLLGFSYTYSDDKKCYTLNETELTGKTALYPELHNRVVSNNNVFFPVEEQPEQIYFEWFAGENYYQEENFLSGVRAYSLGNADVVELYSINRDNINDFFDGGFVIFELDAVNTDMDTQFFSNDEAAHLTYAFLAEINGSIKLYFIVPMEDEWTIMDTKDGVRVYFYHPDYKENDLNISSATQANTNYPDDKIIIPVSESIDSFAVSDEDIYWKKRFCIKINGDWEAFYTQNPIINPYYGINISEIHYDIVNNLTYLTFDTKYICAYQYTLKNNYLEIMVGKPGDLYSKVVLFDAGHGGIDPGAARSGYKEKDINFKIINTFVKDLFADSDIKVYFTRNTDVKIDLYERAAMASRIGADMFISLHLNSSSSSSTNGTEVYYSKENNQVTELGINSYQLAKNLVNALSSELSSKNRGVMNSDFVVTKYNTVPAVLIELGYMTNKSELSKLADETYQKKASETIYRTVSSIFEANAESR